MKTKFTVDYFIKKFKAIPAKKWSSYAFEEANGKRCVLGHTMGPFPGFGAFTLQTNALIGLFQESLSCDPQSVNNQKFGRFKQASPKSRILAALRWIKKQQKTHPN